MPYVGRENNTEQVFSSMGLEEIKADEKKADFKKISPFGLE